MNNPDSPYTLDYFIDKFEAIPENQIGMGKLSQHCVLWHTGTRYENEKDQFGYLVNAESRALINLMGSRSFLVNEINDNVGLGGTPKSRILRALRQLRTKELVKV